MQFSCTYISIPQFFSFLITLVIFVRSHVLPNVYPLRNFITFVAICFKYFLCFPAFKHFSWYSVSALVQNIGKSQMFEIFLSYIHLWWLNTFTYFTFSKTHTIMKVDCLPLMFPVVWAFHLSVNLRSGKGLPQLLLLPHCTWFKPNR